MIYNSKLEIAQLQTFWQLIIRSFVVYKLRLKDQIINGITWSSMNLLVFAYVLPQMGLTNAGSFMLISNTVSAGFWASMNNIAAFLSDINGETSNLNYELTLPIRPWLIFIKYAIVNAYQASLITLIMFPFGVVLIWNEFSFIHFSLFKFCFLILIISILFGFLFIASTSITKNLDSLDDLYSRIIFPLWYLGGFQFSWKGLYSISPTFAYLNLLNPLTYVLEGSRACTLDPALSLPYWNCVFALIGFTILFGYLGIMNLKKRLDCL